MTRGHSLGTSVAHLDEYASEETPIGRIDPRAKLITTIAFLVAVASFGRYQVLSLVPLALYPIALIALGDVPPGSLLWRLVLVSPFALLIGAFNPLLDHTPLGTLGPFHVTGGWASFASIMLRFVLSVSAALLLVATTGFDAVCAALARLGVPRILVVQLLFMHRYLFVLVEEVSRTSRAFALRSPDGSRPSMRVAGTLLGQILLRTLARAQRVHSAMICRGFDGEVRLRRELRWRAADTAFVACWSAYFLLARSHDLTRLLGSAIARTVG